MKLHFEPNLDYHLQTIEAVCDLFRGQEICRTEFTVTMPPTGTMQFPGMEGDLGIGNRLTLLDDDLIRAVRPVLIIDEPQSVDGGLSGAGKTALDAMNPLCTLRYSATHVDKHQMVYRLDAVDAHERGLVKQIEVAAATVEDAHNKPFVRLLKVENRRGSISARVELDVQTASGVKRKELTVQDGDNLGLATGRAIYADCSIGEIQVEKQNKFMELRVQGGEHFLRPGQTWGDVEALAVQRQMIRRTIREHLDKEKRLRPHGIKVLSLFFIDEVAKYRRYDADGNAVKGDYARIFEEEYRRAAKLPDYQTLFSEVDLTHAAEEVHNGYFSIDKKGGWTNTKENNQGNRESAERAYNLIMKEKEKLLSLETPLKFIFSHSALKEGTLVVPEPFAAQLQQITAVLKKLAGRLEIKNADDRRPVLTRQAVLHSPEFKELWERIKHKTTYRVEFDNEKLIESCIKALQNAPTISKTRLQWHKADIIIGKSGVDTAEKAGAATVVLDESNIELPDLLTELQDRTRLTRRTIHRILTESLRLNDFKRNPQQFIECAAEAINRCKRLAVVDGIKYQRLGDDHFYAQELFEQKELTGYLRNLIPVEKSVYEQVVYDSDVEATFADQLEKNLAIKVYAKLPGWFKIPTPLDSYNPDWAVLVEKDGEERIYFVVETKPGLFTDDLRDRESAKIECGKAHFKALAVGEDPARYTVARSVDDMLGLE